MSQFEYVDKLFPEGFKEDIDFLKKELPVLTSSMAELSKQGKAVYDALGSTRNLRDMVDNTSKAQGVNNQVYVTAEAIKAKYNGSSKELITISKGVAATTLSEAKATTENYKQKEIETRYTIALTKEKERLEKARQKENEALNKSLSAYDQLSKEHSAAAKDAQNLAAQHEILRRTIEGTTNAALKADLQSRYDALTPAVKKAQMAADSMHQSLLRIDQAVGNSRRNVGNYNGAIMAMSQILREAPSFAYSFSTGLMGIGNNIPILVDEINKLKVANNELRASGQATVPVWKTLLQAFTSPVGIITTLTGVITIFAARMTMAGNETEKTKKKIDEFKNSFDELKKAWENYNSAIATGTEVEITKAQRLVDVYNSSNTTMKGRINAYEELHGMYPKILTALTDEEKKTLKLSDAHQKEIEKLNEVIAIKNRMAENDKIINASIKAKNEAADQMQGIYKDLSPASIRQLNRLISAQQGDTHITSNFPAQGVDNTAINEYLDFRDKILHLEKSIALMKQAQVIEQTKLVNLENAPGVNIKKEKQKIDEEANLRAMQDYAGDGKLHSKTRDQYDAEQEAKYQARLAVTKDMEQALQDQRTAALEELNKQHEKGAISYEVYTKSKEDMDRRFVKTSLILHKAYYEELLKEFPGDPRLIALISKANSDLAELYAQDAKAYAEAQKKKAEAAKKASDKTRDMITEAVNQSIDTNQAFVDAYYEKQISHQENLLAAINERKQAEIDAINESMLSEDKKQKQIRALNAQTAAQEKQIQNEIRRMKREQAIADRVAATLRVVEHTAEAISKAVSESPKTGGLPWSAIAAAIGAAQVAAIFAQPLPQYGEGTPKDKVGHPGGAAIIGDKPEYVFEPGKKPYFTDKTHVRFLPRHTRVIPEAQLAAGSMGFLTPGLLQNIITPHSGDMSELKEEMRNTADRIASAIKNKPETQFIATNGEFRKVVRRGNSNTEYLSDNFSA